MRKFVQVKQAIREVKNARMKYTVVSVFTSYRADGHDLMKRGGKFYAVLNHETGMWSTNESDLIVFIDREIDNYISKHFRKNEQGDYVDGTGTPVQPEYLNDSSTGRLKEFNVWLQNVSPNHNYISLDSDMTFKDEKVTPEMYRSKRLEYKLEEGECPSYEKLISTLYTEENRRKIEWSIGSVFAGDSKKIEKILVLYGDPGTGKSTILDLIKTLLRPYWNVFVAQELVSSAHQFATAAFKDNPLVAIQDDGSLARIESPIINEIISHKDVMINEKGKQQYTIKSNAMLFLATNKFVDIHDTKLGITRRLLDVYPSGNKIPVKEYRQLVARLDFEIPYIAQHCLDVYKSLGIDYYEGYVPDEMIAKTNYIRNFLFDNLEKYGDREIFLRDDMYNDYKFYSQESGLDYMPKRLVFGEQLQEYFKEYYNVKWVNGKAQRHVYVGLKVSKIMGLSSNENVVETEKSWLAFDSTESEIDRLYSDWPAQYATEEGGPTCKWEKCKTKLKDIDTSKLHWFKLPDYIVKVDFDKKDSEGNKNLELNIKAASKFAPTYAEVSKSGNGIHLYYIYDGDVNKLSRLCDENVEIKLSTGGNSHRRILTKTNGLPIARISTGLPLKGEKPVVDENIVLTERGLRTTINKCLAKQVHGDTTSNIDFIYKILDDAYKSGIVYDVSDLWQDVYCFAGESSHQSEKCLNKVRAMHFKSESEGEYVDEYGDAPIIFFDVEVFPNLIVVCWKYAGEDKPVMKMINPGPGDIERLVKYRLIGFNNKEYDNHILYAIMMNKSILEVYYISQGIINNQKGSKFSQAYNLSYTDIFDFCSKKQSLKKWEIALKIHHQELGLPWDKPVDEKMWEAVAGYCANDVLATEAVFNAREADFKGRQILCDLANIFMGPGSTVNDSTNTLTTKLIVGNDKHPQSKFVYPDLAKEFPGYEFCKTGIDPSRYISPDVIITGKSIYKGYDPGEGGFVWAKHGMYGLAESDDSASHHPSSIIAENGFGEYTPNFKRLLDLRLSIKHKEYDKLRTMYDGALAKYLETDADAKALSFALKIAINSVYGLTAARFKHPLRDERNVDNWVAKRGALFMIDLMLNVQAMGYTVIHCKTDSIKILDPDDKVRNYIYEYGKKYGYTFEIENRFDRICLVNDAVYVCKYTDEDVNGDERGKWHATGKQFQVPYVFKTLFSHEDIELDDVCETKNTTTALYLDFNENLGPDEHQYQFVGKTGQFCPVKPGCGGGVLYREKDGKFYAAESTKGYRWLESEVIRTLHREADVDDSFYKAQVDKAVATINKFGDFDDFVSDTPFFKFMNIPEDADDEIPFL